MEYPEPLPDPSQLFDDSVQPHTFSNKPVEEHLVIKLPPKIVPNGVPPLRRSRRGRTVSDELHPEAPQPSGSEYQESDNHTDEDPPAPEEVFEEKPIVEFGRSARGRRIKKKSYQESEDDDLNGMAEAEDDDDDDEGEQQPRRSARNSAKRDSFIASEDDADVPGRALRSKKKKPSPPTTTSSGRITRQPQRIYQPNPPPRLGRHSRRRVVERDEGYVDEPSSGSADGEDSLADAPHTSSDLDLDADGEPDLDGEDAAEPEADVRYAFRQRDKKVNYAIPPPLEIVEPKSSKPRSRGKGGKSRSIGWSAGGAELSRLMDGPADDSDSDYGVRPPHKSFPGGVFGGAVAGGGGGMLSGDLAPAAGAPSNLGKVGGSALADVDPLGVNTNVTFDEVGGLDDHIHSLKEMTLLPLLYPEVFQRFNLTPPRGVLFHGPPGTGKTLLARALAASCRANGKGISFFMRKGADCLSKWVGEAERQLRLLFEEARNCQPSIIFFDEIDGLAPVRSSKQDQIHASIVSTLLALMDGMDGRGQVIVIGATNRPDAIDPALRRPGRFDREFYFPLPSLDSRERILTIMTKDWEGWDGEKGAESTKALAKLTKGYGGADLRALCTEAALNAIQRRYPQIYKSADRLLLQPETIGVNLRDFMISVKKLVPSSARSSSSSASPLPTQLAPLLSGTLEKIKDAINRVLPAHKKRTALEEAEWEDDSEEGALEREMLMQSMEMLQVYRPRLVLHGPIGMGQGYIGAAALHHLEGYHVQSLDLGSLMGDSARTVEAGIIQLFVEAKRHQPSVIYIPSLVGWCAAVPETSRSTVRAMLDTLAPTDPILLLAVVDGSFSSLPRDVRAWFGPTRENRLELPRPDSEQREAFFESLISDIHRPPNKFADGVTRKKRILEELPIAPPIEPRQPTAAELAVQEDNDQRIITLLKYRLGPILTELKRKFKRFTKRATEEYDFNPSEPVALPPPQPQVDVVTTLITTESVANEMNGTVETEQQQHQLQLRLQEAPPNGDIEMTTPTESEPADADKQRTLQNIDLEKMHVDLYRSKYLTPEQFLGDVYKIMLNADLRQQEDPERLHKAQAMYTAAQVSIHEFDPQLKLECARMAPRQRKRREEMKKNKKKDNDKGKAPDDSQSSLPTRRSTRHNGQHLEMTMEDPVQIERRNHKRQRSEGAAGSPMSGEENTEDAAAPRHPKRAKVIISDDEADPMDIIGHSPSQPNGVVVEIPPDHITFDTFQPTPNHAPLPEANSPPRQSNVFQLLGPQTPPLPPPPQVEEPMMPQTEEIPPMEQLPEMEIARSPTPLPEFHIDEYLVTRLKFDLRTRTSSLTIEQLEQLRATCLGYIWRHRTVWDRDDLVREIQAVVDEFLDDVSLDASDLESAEA